MKQKDIILIVLIVFISGLLSYILASKLIGSPSKRSYKVEQVEKISADFNKPSTKYFNSESVNPTILIQIGDTKNQQPF